MMGFGHMSGGGYSSSSNSNLSAFAAPFTVDRQSPNPYSSNPGLRYSTSSYGIKPYSHEWDQYVSPSAPVTEVQIDSTGTVNQASVDDYRYKSSVSQSPSSGHWSGAWPDPTAGAKYTGGVFDYGGEMDPYHPPFVPTSVGEDDSFWVEGSRYNLGPSCGIGFSSQADYNGVLLDFESKRQYADGSSYGNNSMVELDGSLLSLKVNDGSVQTHPYQGGGRTYGDKSVDDSGSLYQHSTDVPNREVSAGPFSVGNVEDQSRIHKLLGFIPYESNGSNLAGCNSNHPQPSNLAGCSSNHPQPRVSIPSFETPKSFSSYHNAFGSYEKCQRTIDSPFTGLVSVTRPSPAVVIRPPPAGDCNLLQTNISHEAAPKDNDAGSRWMNFDNSGSLRQKDSLLNLGCEMEENILEAKLITDPFLLSSSVVELPSLLLAENTLDKNIGGKSGSKMSSMNASDGFPGARENIKLAMKSKDVIDYQNPAVDSPCWRGAPPSQFSPFDVESVVSNPVNTILSGNNAVHHEELENPTSPVHSPIARSENVEGNGNGENGVPGNGLVSTLKRTFSDINSSREASLLGNTETGVEVSTASSNVGVQVSDEPNISGKNFILLNDLKIGFDTKTSSAEQVNEENNAGMTLNDVPEGGAVAVHAAEKVLASPSSQKDAEISNTSDPKLNIPVLIKAIHNLSELILCHINCDAFNLDKESAEALRRTISNLKSCKQISLESNETHTDIPVGDILGISGDPANMINLLGGHATHEAKNSHVQLKCLQDEKRKYRSVTKKEEKSPVASLLMDDMDISRTDDVTKAINRVLEENSHFDEGMHPQALLFKNLWLESEAELCSISYRARFDRMRIQMEKIKADALQGVDDSAELMAQADFNGGSSEGLEVRDITAEKCTSGHAEIEASIMDRFNILKSRGENINDEAQQQSMIGSDPSGSGLAQHSISKCTDEEVEQQSKVIDGVQSVMSRFDILKSRDNFKSDNAAEEFQMKTIDEDDEQVSPIMARYRILKSRDEDLNSNNVEKAEMGDGECVVNEKHAVPFTGGPLETRTASNLIVEPYFSYPREGDFYGYESLKEYISSKSDSVLLNPFLKGKTVNEDRSGWPDNSSSDWEHV